MADARRAAEYRLEPGAVIIHQPGIDASDIRAMVICIARAAAADWPGPGWILDCYLSLVLDSAPGPGRALLAGSPPSR